MEHPATADNSYCLGTLSNMKHEGKPVSGRSVHQQPNEKNKQLWLLKIMSLHSYYK